LEFVGRKRKEKEERKKEERFGELRETRGESMQDSKRREGNEERTMMRSVRFSENDGLGARWKS